MLMTTGIPSVLLTISTRWVHLGLVLITVTSSTVTFPHYLSYINQIVGGPDRGPHLLDDSDLDWGQDIDWLSKYEPVARAGYSIYLYNFPSTH